MDNPLIYISLLALVIKLYGIKVLCLRWYPVQSGYLLGLLLFFTVLQNLIELSGYYFMLHPNNPLISPLFKLFYVALTANLILIPLSISALIFFKLKLYWFYLTFFIYLLLSIAICTTDLIIAGFQVYTYSITRMPGDYYYAYQAFILLSLSFTVYILFFARYFAKNNFNKGKLTNLIIGFLPFSLSISFIVLSMALGLKINAAAIFPFFFSLFILVLAFNFGRTSIFDLSVFLPFSKKFKLWFTVAAAIIKHVKHLDSQPNDLATIAHSKMILAAYDMFPTQKQAAEFLQMSPAQFSRLLKKYRKL